MSIEKSRGKSQFSEWDEAIEEARSQIKDLRKAIKVFAEKRDAGLKWPGFQRRERRESPLPQRVTA